MKVEVAVLMQPFGAFRVPAPVVERSDWYLRWAERAKASFDVDPAETIGSILNQGAAELGVLVDPCEGRLVLASEEVAGIAFFVDDAEEGRSKGRRIYPTADDSGVARWDEDIASVTLARALAARRAGLFAGDPRRIYLVPQSPAGAFGSADWSLVLHYLRVGEDVLERIGADVAGAAVICAACRATWGAARRVLRGRSSQWHRRGGSPLAVGDLVSGRDRVADVATLLDCSVEEAEALVEFFQAGAGVGADDQDPDAVVAALRRGVVVLSGAGFEFLSDGPQEAERVLEQIARDVLSGHYPTDEEVRTRIFRVVNPHYGEWA